MDAQDTTPLIIGAAIAVHRALGPGLLESAYQQCPLSIVYGGVRIPCGYRMDFVVNDSVVVEIKAVETTLPIHEAQVLSYLKLSGLTVWSAAELQRRVDEAWDSPVHRQTAVTVFAGTASGRWPSRPAHVFVSGPARETNVTGNETPETSCVSFPLTVRLPGDARFARGRPTASRRSFVLLAPFVVKRTME
jgi:GxxExxY protein